MARISGDRGLRPLTCCCPAYSGCRRSGSATDMSAWPTRRDDNAVWLASAGLITNPIAPDGDRSGRRDAATRRRSGGGRGGRGLRPTLVGHRRVLRGAVEPAQAPAERADPDQRQQTENGVGRTLQVDRPAARLPLQDLLVRDERPGERGQRGDLGGGNRAVRGQVDGDRLDAVAGVETQQGLSLPVDRHWAGGAVDAGSDPLELHEVEPGDCAVVGPVATLSADDVEPLSVVRGGGWVQVDGGVHGAARGGGDVGEIHGR